MKNFFLLATSLAVLAACSKTEPATTGELFEAGQKVTLCVSASASDSKVSSQYNGEGGIDFTWQKGDKIKVTVGTESAEFTLKSGADSATATFEGEMPAAGDKFDVQYPVTTPSIGEQAYTTEQAFEKDKMLFAAKNCTYSSTGANNFQLKAQNAVLKLKLYGKNLTMTKIDIINTDVTPNTKNTLTLGSGIKIGDTEATANTFSIIVPAGQNKFTVWTYVQYDMNKVEYYVDDQSINHGKGTPITEAVFYAPSQKITAGEVLEMPVKELRTVIFAPKNLGYVANDYKWGKLYQWGRYAGCGYYEEEGTNNDAELLQTSVLGEDYSQPISSPDDDKFYYAYHINTHPASTMDWYSTTKDGLLPAWPVKSGDTGYLANKLADPCPSEWKIPAKDDYDFLVRVTLKDFTGTDDDGMKGCRYNTIDKPENKVFFGINGYRAIGGNFKETGIGSTRGIQSRYWTTDTKGSDQLGVYALDVYASDTYVNSHARANACSIRCVQASQD